MASIRRRKTTQDGVSRYDVLWREGGKQTSAVLDDYDSRDEDEDGEDGPESAVSPQLPVSCKRVPTRPIRRRPAQELVQ